MSFTPGRYQSGETDRVGAITRAGDPRARAALFEAANVMMTWVACWFPSKAWTHWVFGRVAARRGAKLAVILHHLSVDGTDFRAQVA